ncbi:MAG: hypothetical protein KatS3mg108_2936 [Isosphaeraceae bacterium]|jgi:hypothetical protein|nr:MAG: hypothetical protein KatS3mg108_2936 [Isosphaeraceae bacterium]
MSVSWLGHQPATATLGLLGLALTLASGCSQPNVFSRQNAQVAALRENVNQLEIEKDRLERQLADLTAENRQLEDRLVREEARSAQLARRLEDARRHGSSRLADDPEDPTTARRDGAFAPDGASAQPSGPSRRRRLPVAQIPGEIEPWTDSRPADDFAPRGRFTPLEDEPAEADLFPSSLDLGARSDDPDRGRWLPVAGRPGSPRR